MNNRGFSLAELLAVIALIGILSGVAIGAVSNYRQKASTEAYDSIFTAASNGCEIYIMDNSLDITLENNQTGSVTLSELVEEEYMTNPTDPNSKTDCSGKVEYKMKKGSTSTNDYIVYRVTLNCPNRAAMQKIFPEGSSF